MPSTRQIANALDIRSASIVDRDLDHLAQAGVIGRDRHVARGIRLIDPPAEGLAEAVGYLDTIAVTWRELRARLSQDDPMFTLAGPGADMDRLVGLAEEYVHERHRHAGAPV